MRDSAGPIVSFRPSRVLVGIGACIGLLGTVALHGVGAQPKPPSPTFITSSHNLAVGTELTISGAGCIDPDTSTGTGNFVGAGLRPADVPGVLEGLMLGPAAVNPDGSWSISGLLGEPMPSGDQLLAAGCFRGEPGGGEMFSLLFEYAPQEVTATSPPVEGIEVHLDQISIDNPCIGQTAMPPYGPEVGADLLDASGWVANLEQMTIPLETNTERISFQVASGVSSGTYDLRVVCLSHRVSRPVRIVQSTVNWKAPATPPSPSTPPASPAAVPAPTMSGRPSYTG